MEQERFTLAYLNCDGEPRAIQMTRRDVENFVAAGDRVFAHLMGVCLDGEDGDDE